jgi:signal transduction histidine kinase
VKTGSEKRFSLRLALLLAAVMTAAMGLSDWIVVTAARRHFSREARAIAAGERAPTALELTQDHLDELRVAVLAASAVSFSVTMLLAWLLSGSLVRSVSDLALKLEAEMARVRRLESASRELVADASHELRTPLASISAFAEILAGPASPPPARLAECALEIGRGAARMTDLVEELLDLSALESARPAAPAAEVPVTECAARAAAETEGARSAAGARLAIDVPPGLTVRADGGQLTRALRNLLENASKFGGPGGAIRLSGRRTAGGTVELQVEDDGAGFKPEDLDRVFERFYRAETSRAREHGGAGLGLAIVKRIVENHGGRARAENAPGRGARVVLVFPA